MISDFIYKYYIDPIRYGEAYNVVDTLTYAIILVIGVYILYRWLSASTYLSDAGFRFDGTFILATVPYVILGGLLRVVEDTGMIESDWRFLLITPLIYFTLFFFVIGMMFLARELAVRGITKNFIQFYAFAGIAAMVIASLVLLGFGMAHNGIDLVILSVIPLMAVTATAVVWGVMRYALGWSYVSDPVYLTLIFGQLLDASATSYGIDLHPHVQYVEQHVVGSTLIAMTGTAFVMFPLKLIVLFPAVYVMQLYRKEASPAFWHLVLLAMIVVGFAPGVRDMVRMVLYV
ncbi:MULTISPECIES: DUF63 family protein [unclassified Methanoregula]|uniref:DUF63 family protein n=1 Tax=unclassified Methanoregula TaxID=2649730 RepID=UPI0009C7E60B|nr:MULTISPECIES: DUF63 family protein [unclassified Methanoregula]OPX63354.1 MAG: hypothetical protein A4E33_01723 [Methanoregula sp. PtaB.Bin085]OPY35042.1 MAG: hypothetical protein A4E34_01064 [Methanoregula sp. PtaU1.Bin006]